MFPLFVYGTAWKKIYLCSFNEFCNNLGVQIRDLFEPNEIRLFMLYCNVNKNCNFGAVLQFLSSMMTRFKLNIYCVAQS